MISKRTHLFGFLLFVGTSLLVWTTLPNGRIPAAPSSHKLSKYDRIDLAIQQEVEMTRDLATGEVPRERLIPAFQQAERQRMIFRQNPSRAAINGLSWQERGPNNVAGRVRTILIDANDPTGRTIWTAGVAGGLWKSEDIAAADPAWVGIDDFFENMAITTLVQHPTYPDTPIFWDRRRLFQLRCGTRTRNLAQCRWRK